MPTAATKRDLLAEAHEYAAEIAKERADEYAPPRTSPGTEAKLMNRRERRRTGDMPAGWTRLVTYWSNRPHPELLRVPPRDWARDAVLCPEHAQTLEHQLKDIVAREALARVLERYHDDFPDEYHFALGATAPALLQEIFGALLGGSEADEKQEEKEESEGAGCYANY
jgi:hypothetical protein